MDLGGVHLGIVAGAFLYGLRHGIDLDHLAAISDITSSQQSRARSLVLASAYAGGHALVVLVLGFVAVTAGAVLPLKLDDVMEHVVGVSLLLLSGYVFYSVIRYGRDFRLRSRWALLFEGVRRTFRWLKGIAVSQPIEIEHSHEHAGADHDHSTMTIPPQRAAVAVSAQRHRHAIALPDDPFLTYGLGSAAAVGMLHGIGAETPTQVLVLVSAAGVGGTGASVLLLGAFVVGLLISNTAVAVASTVGFEQGRRAPTIYLTLALLTGFASLVMGLLYVAGKAELLPSLFG